MPRFKHQIRLLTSNGSAIIATFWTARAFDFRAQQMFQALALRHFGEMREVKDSTLAGRHFANNTGAVVVELI